MKGYLIFSLLMCYHVIVLSQQIDNSILWSPERLAEMNQSEDDIALLTDQLNYFKSFPLDINFSSYGVLMASKLFSDVEANSIIKHRALFGPLLCFEELQVIDAFSIEEIAVLVNYIQLNKPIIEEKYNLGSLISNGTGYISCGLQRSYVFGEKDVYQPYEGSLLKANTRFKFSSGNYFSIAVTGEKDAGESFLNNHQKAGYDFYSFHFYVMPNRCIKSLVVGDFQLQYGQGLVMWKGLAFGKSSEVMNIKKIGLGISPYSSTGEAGFFRGIAMALNTKLGSIDFWLSNRNIDASIYPEDTSARNWVVGTINESGMHRTYDEINHKGNLQEQVIGAHIPFKYRQLNVGLTTNLYHYNVPLGKGSELYEKFEPYGKSFVNHGLNFSYLWSNVNLFGEVAIDQMNHTAYLMGLIAALDRRISVSLLSRNYSAGYFSQGANAFRDASKTTNEQGRYIGITYNINKQWKFNSMLDIAQSHWLKYNQNQRGKVNEKLMQISFVPNRTTDIYIRYRTQNSISKDINDEVIIPSNVTTNQKNIRINFKFKLSGSINMQTRFEKVSVANNGSGLQSANGNSMAIDISYKELGTKFSFSCRYLLYDTDDYNSRIYAYEMDLPGSYSIPSVSGNGERYAIMMKWKPSRNFDCWFKLAMSKINDEGFIIRKDKEMPIDFKLLLKYKLQ